MRFQKINKITQTLLALFCLTGMPTLASADTAKPFIIGGFAFGGETLVSTTGEDLDAGGFIYAGAGVMFEPDHSELMYQISLGYKFDTVEFTGPNGDSTVSVIPVDAVAFYKIDNLRLGAGLAYFLNPKWELCVDGTGCGTANFDDALGLVLELRHQWTDILFWGARYTNVDYEIGSSTLDASNLRIHFGMVF
ncbi:MAG TPA: hypothetical protein ENI97_01110 [Gammaproteobacteria bacterium]|nr:hypothetical protein [Gammaproteobacteria bacterium]